MACVTDYNTGWQMCGIAVNPVQVGQPVVAGFTLSAGPTQIGADDFGGVVVNDAGQVIATFPAQPAVVPLPLPPNLWLQFTSDEPIGPDEAGRQIVVWLGPTSVVGGYNVGDTFPADAAYGLALYQVVQVPGGVAPPPGPPPGGTGGASFALGQPVVQGAPVAGGPVTVVVGVTNEGGTAGSDTVSGSVSDASTGQTVATFPSRSSGAVQPGATVNVTLSATLPGSVAGRPLIASFSDSYGNQVQVRFTVSGASGTGTTPPPTTTQPSRSTVLAVGLGIAGAVGLVALIAAVRAR